MSVSKVQTTAAWGYKAQIIKRDGSFKGMINKEFDIALWKNGEDVFTAKVKGKTVAYNKDLGTALFNILVALNPELTIEQLKEELKSCNSTFAANDNEVQLAAKANLHKMFEHDVNQTDRLNKSDYARSVKHTGKVKQMLNAYYGVTPTGIEDHDTGHISQEIDPHLSARVNGRRVWR